MKPARHSPTATPAPADVLSFPKGRKVHVFYTGETIITLRKGNRVKLAQAWARFKSLPPVEGGETAEEGLRALRERL